MKERFLDRSFFMPGNSGRTIDPARILLYAGGMENHRILIVGDTLFAEMLIQLLGQSSGILVVGSAPNLTSAENLLAAEVPDAVIYARKTEQDDPSFSRFITNHPDLPLLCTELSSNAVQVVVSRNIDIHSSKDLFAAIKGLRKPG